VLDHPEVVAGRVVLDLGSGSGLVAVAARRAGAARVVASDVDPFSVTAIPLNAAANGVSGVEVVGDVLDGPLPDGVTVVLAGDVCYARAMTGRVLGFLDAALAAGADVLIGDPGRAYLPGAGLQPVAAYEVPDVDGAEPRRTAVYRVGEVSHPGNTGSGIVTDR
jgi:predicted nicotinamide N-methyase